MTSIAKVCCSDANPILNGIAFIGAKFSTDFMCECVCSVSFGWKFIGLELGCRIQFDNYMFKWRFYYVCYVQRKFLLRFVVFPLVFSAFSFHYLTFGIDSPEKWTTNFATATKWKLFPSMKWISIKNLSNPIFHSKLLATILFPFHVTKSIQFMNFINHIFHFDCVTTFFFYSSVSLWVSLFLCFSIDHMFGVEIVRVPIYIGIDVVCSVAHKIESNSKSQLNLNKV